jgi:hypothetical protein
MNEVVEKQPPSKSRILAFWLISLFFMFALFELLASVVLINNYRSSLVDSAELLDEVSSFSSVNLLYKAANRLNLDVSGLFDVGYQRFSKVTDPDPFFQADPVLGYSAAPAAYTHSYFLRQGADAEMREIRIKNTINEDGSRWTGLAPKNPESSVYVFGDSVIYGTGVHDEHTFSYLLQQARPELRVKLFALGGYSLTQAYLRFEQIKDSLTADDVVILGYGDFYDLRHVMSPSYLQARRGWTKRMDKKNQGRNFSLPRVSGLDEGNIEISYVDQNCELNKVYCEGEDPSSSEKTRVTAALINYIANNTAAKVYLLHFNGNPENPALEMVAANTTLISVLPGDFDSFVKDDIEGFDPHPGPYWHHAVSRRILQALPGTE